MEKHRFFSTEAGSILIAPAIVTSKRLGSWPWRACRPSRGSLIRRPRP